MNPQLLSLLTTLVTSACTSLAAWLVAHGALQASDQATFITSLTAVILSLIGAAAVAVWKMLQHTKAAQIAAVNRADNGVKVVASAAPAPQVETPLK